jgi:deoxyadenosine/deoxycytidine kinase
MLQQDYNCQLVLEQFTDNPFLPLFYKEPGRYAFPVELFFMSERYKQLQECLIDRDLFNHFILSDYFFQKTALFAQNNLNEEEYQLFLRFHRILDGLFPKPDLLVYLHRPVDQLYKQIRKRNRKIEADLKLEYLAKIESAYFSYFNRSPNFPILIIDLGDMNFKDNLSDYEQLKKIIFQKYKPGIHEIGKEFM